MGALKDLRDLHGGPEGPQRPPWGPRGTSETSMWALRDLRDPHVGPEGPQRPPCDAVITVVTPFLSRSPSPTHTHTHTHIYVCVCVCVTILDGSRRCSRSLSVTLCINSRVSIQPPEPGRKWKSPALRRGIRRFIPFHDSQPRGPRPFHRFGPAADGFHDATLPEARGGV